MGKQESSWRIEAVHEDDCLIAVVKPAGLPTANAPQGKESLYTLLSHRFGPAAFVGIVSRLDAPVSGLIVVAKTPAAAADLAGQFRDRTVHKRYLAVVAGRFPAPLGQWVEWNDTISRAEGDRCSVIVPSGPPASSESESARSRDRRAGQKSGSGGGPSFRTDADADDRASLSQEATTRARVRVRAGEVSLVELEPVTGRRHQLRVQLASRGCPIVGDRQYGSRLPYPEPGGIALHAAELEFTHPSHSQLLRLEAPLPAAWRTRFAALLRNA